MRRLALVVTLVGAVASCRPRPAGVGNGPYADKVAADIPQIERALGVKYKRPPVLEVRSREQVRDFLLKKLNDSAAQREVSAEEATYKLLGLLPDTMHLNAFLVRVLTEQIIGYYDPSTKVLYVVDAAPEEYAGITIMHELVHALQDQYVNLDSLEHVTGDDDRQAAAQAVIEGQAVYEQVYLMSGGNGNIANQLPGGWESLRTEIRAAQSTQPVFASAPMVIQESLLFPYVNGADFVRRFNEYRKGRQPWDSLPQTTKQVMHDAAFFGKTPDAPSAIALPGVPGTIATNDFGEFGTRLFLYKHLYDLGIRAIATPTEKQQAIHRAEEQAMRGASGLDGDRYALIKTSSGNAFVWVTVWDTPLDAAEFTTALDDVMKVRFNVAPKVTAGVRRFTAGSRTIEVSSRDVGNRPVVFYVDVPAGTSVGLVDLSKVQVTPR